MALSACQPDSGGDLYPIKSADVTVRDGKVAILSDGPMEARVTARWSDIGSNSMVIRYRNSGTTPVRIPVKALRMRHAIGEAYVRTVIDRTGVDMTDAREDNNRGKTLFSLDGEADGGGQGSGVLEVPAGATREIDAFLTSFANEGRVAAGDRVTATVPLAGRNVAVAFIARRPSLLP
ncbi:MAG: hypothetical protein ABW182_01705 [Sphingomonas sp.]